MQVLSHVVPAKRTEGEFAGGIGDDKMSRLKLQAVSPLGQRVSGGRAVAACDSTCYRDIVGTKEALQARL